MFFEDDDGDFSPAVSTGGSKLASLFGMGAGSTADNGSLTYTAPKQPKAKDDSKGKAEARSSPSVLNATAVHTFRFVNGQYVKQGKLGIAILGNHTDVDYKILLYVSQKQPVAAAKIHPNFNFTAQKNNYASFYDDQSQMWSICFDNSAAANDFGKWVALAKFNCSPVGLLIQDLVVGDGQPIAKGDSIELQYTGYLYSNQSFGKVFESNKDSEKLYKMKVGKGKVIKGWEEGVLGMKKNGRRLLVIPPGLAYGSKAIGDRIPPNSTLIFEIEVTRAKFANPDPSFSRQDSASSSSSTQDTSQSSNTQKQDAPVSSDKKTSEETETSSASTPNADAAKSSVEEQPSSPGGDNNEEHKGRTLSLTEQLSKSLERPARSDLLVRMSKMGKAMIGSPQASSGDQVTTEIATEADDSQRKTTKEEKVHHEDESHSESASRPALKPRPENAGSNQRNVHDNHASPRVASHHQDSPNYSSLPQQHLNQPIAIYQQPHQMYGGPPMSFVQAMPPMQAMPASSAQPSADINLLISESKINHGEIKFAVTRVTERINDLILKVDRLENVNLRQEVAKPMIASGSEMEASVLASNINRIIQENEKLKKECTEKTKKIEALNERISDMLLKNQSFLERSNQLMEERADSIKSNTTQTMTKINALEHENMSLTSQIASLKTELSGFLEKCEEANNRESELKTKLRNLNEERDSALEKLESASSNVSDHKEELEQFKNKLKDEKQERKKLKNRLDHLDEELQEMKQEKESLEKAVNDRKKKQQSDRKKFEEEIEELKNSHEEELHSLKQRYKKGSLENEKIAAVEAELEARHQENLKKAVKDTEERLEEKCQELSVELGQLKSENLHMAEKLSKFSILEEKNSDLERLVEDLEAAKQESADKTNGHVEDLKRKLAHLLEQNESAKKESYERGYQDGKAESSSQSATKVDETAAGVAEEVKKVMNAVFFKLKSEFEADQSYTGKEIIKEILQTIRDLTLKMTEESQEENEGQSDDESEEEESAEEEYAEEESEEEESEEEESEEEENAKEASEEEENAKEASEEEENAEEASEEEENAEEESGEKDVTVEQGTKKEDNEQDATVDNDEESEDKAIDFQERTSPEGPVSEDESQEEEETMTVCEKAENKASEENEDENTSVSQAGGADEEDVGSVTEVRTPLDQNCDEEDFDNAKEDVDGLKGCENQIDTEKAVGTIEREEGGEPEGHGLEESVDGNAVDGETNQDAALASSLEDGEQQSQEVEDDGMTAAGGPLKHEDNVEVAASSVDSQNEVYEKKEKENAKTKAELFADDDDDNDDEDFFASSKSASASKTSVSSAFSRSPPPLFDDDDEDTN